MPEERDATSVAIVRQGLSPIEVKIAQVRRLLHIRAFTDAERKLREAADELVELADRLGPPVGGP